jgi:NADPH:quinone reductase-like Zn-dependent oxidoreductase
MKAVVYENFGSPDVLELKEIPTPEPNETQVLVKVFASTVNRTDCGFRSGRPLFARPFYGMFKPKYPVLGNEFAGEIVSVGKNVTEYKTGDRVFGYNDESFGGHAQFLVLDEKSAMATLPEKFSFEEAAPLTEGAHYALCDIRAAKIKAGQQVLVNGGTGAIGSAAIQILAAMDVQVTAVCHTQHLELVRSLGAKEVIDYTKEDFTKRNQTFDVVFDAVGKSTFGKCKPILKEGGIYMSTELGPGAQNPFLALITPFLGGKKVLFPIPITSREDILYLKGLAETGKFRPVIDRKYPLEKTAEAYRYVETGMKTGNVVITIPQEG